MARFSDGVVNPDYWRADAIAWCLCRAVRSTNPHVECRCGAKGETVYGYAPVPLGKAELIQMSDELSSL